MGFLLVAVFAHSLRILVLAGPSTFFHSSFGLLWVLFVIASSGDDEHFLSVGVLYRFVIFGTGVGVPGPGS